MSIPCDHGLMQTVQLSYNTAGNVLTYTFSLSDLQQIATLVTTTLRTEILSDFKSTLTNDLKTTLNEIFASFFNSFSEEIKALKQENINLKQENDKLKTDLDQLEQYSRRNSIRITGIPEKEGENTDNLVKELVVKMSIPISETDLDRSHRSDLTKHRKGMFKSARQMYNQKKFKKVWTWDGKIFVLDLLGNKHRIDCPTNLIRFDTLPTTYASAVSGTQHQHLHNSSSSYMK